MKIEPATCLNPSSATFSRSFPQNLQLPHSFRPLGGGNCSKNELKKSKWFGAFCSLGFVSLTRIQQ
ncbi:unnamed protein product [Coffea canephora]|uniref:Uncharacterized protein n=1 Tax=Coffea canephora TaxID=49390 RepID=A0A068UH74_COFCA|nr:unnamed protein product [Coffea canephora]